jgi:hypothetical protein
VKIAPEFQVFWLLQSKHAITETFDRFCQAMNHRAKFDYKEWSITPTEQRFWGSIIDYAHSFANDVESFLYAISKPEGLSPITSIMNSPRTPLPEVIEMQGVHNHWEDLSPPTSPHISLMPIVETANMIQATIYGTTSRSIYL